MLSDLLPTLLLLQSIMVRAQFPPMPKSAHFTQIACPSATAARNNQLALYDKDGKPLGAVNENCSAISRSCKVEGFSDVTIGPYTVKHSGAIFGPCAYHNLGIEITATDGSTTATQQLFATCKVVPFVCQIDEDRAVIGQLNEVVITEFPSDITPTSIILQEYNKDGCPADQNFGDQISNTVGCNLITNTGISNVIVIPKPDMPSTCILTLYDDMNCASTSNANIGPIAPGTDPSGCIGPIRNLNGDVFEAKGAMLKC